MFLRAESVQRELSLGEEQRATITQIVEGAELPLWRLRDLPPQERDRAVRPIRD